MSPIPAQGYLKEILAQDEAVLFESRQHVLLLLGHIVGEVFFALVVIAAGVTVQVFLLPDRPEIAWFYLLALLPAARLAWKVLAWRGRRFVITSRRVIQLSGVLKKVVIDSLLEKVNDLKTDQSLFGRIFDYGDIEILTASEAGKNDLRFIARPLAFKRALLDATEAIDRKALQ
jgi:uncharacterized membrane protein YdbT with pleckstrin-like domain